MNPVRQKVQLELNFRPLLYSIKTAATRFKIIVKRYPPVIYALCVLLVAGAVYHFARSTVTVYVDAEPVHKVHTFSRTVDEVLSELGLTLHPKDRVSPDPSTVLLGRGSIHIEKAFPVFVVADRTVTEVWTPPIELRQLLEEEGFVIGPHDRVEPDINELTASTEIRIIRVDKAYTTERMTIPYEEEVRGNPALDRGLSRVVQHGRDGLQENLLEITYEDGEKVSERVIDQVILETPANKILEMGENTRLERDGRVMEFKQVYIMSATAYCPGTPGSGCPTNEHGHSFCTGADNNGYTYTGKRAVQGSGTLDSPRMVAVDPNVIPLGSMLYIEGFGFARAEDIGGAIKGNRIDILYDLHRDVASFGVKRGIKVYLLTKY